MSDIVLGMRGYKSFCHCLYPQGTDSCIVKKLADNYPKICVTLVKLEDPSESR